MDLFRIETNQCERCKRAEFYVVGLDGVDIGISFEDEGGAQDHVDTLHRGAAAERSRARRELLAAMPAQPSEYLGSFDYTKGWNAAARMADEVVRNVLPEEG